MKLEDIKFNPEAEKLAVKLHEWYLEASMMINPDNVNPKAQKSYEELNDQQKFLDRYIAKRTLSFLKEKKNED